MNLSKNKNITLGFYNIENLFDTENDPFTADDDFLPTSKKRWTEKRYQNKIFKIGKVISEMGDVFQNQTPSVLGLAEVENKSVIEDLLNHDLLKNYPLDFVHFNSPDDRGIDTALIYNLDIFNPISSEALPVIIYDEINKRDYTRDILLVKGEIYNETIYILVNHWSSRRGGKDKTNYKRIIAAERLCEIVNQIYEIEKDAKIVVMGDFNDNPENESLSIVEKHCNLFNPFKHFPTESRGSLNHNFEWHLFDQILLSKSFFQKESSLKYENANIFDDKFLKKYKGQPFRTYFGKKYKGGYSDHFPVYVKFSII